MSKNLDKLKQFFKSNKTNSAQEKVYVLNSEIERELRKDSSNEKRKVLLRELGDIVVVNRLEEVRTICLFLTSNNNPFLVRHRETMDADKGHD